MARNRTPNQFVVTDGIVVRCTRRQRAALNLARGLADAKPGRVVTLLEAVGSHDALPLASVVHVDDHREVRWF